MKYLHRILEALMERYIPQRGAEPSAWDRWDGRS
jgi:hypothetical protein